MDQNSTVFIFYSGLLKFYENSKWWERSIDCARMVTLYEYIFGLKARPPTNALIPKKLTHNKKSSKFLQISRQTHRR